MGYVWKHIFRKPLAALAVLCFGAVIALTLCGLKKAQAEALVQYQEVFRNVKVDCRVTNLTGSQSDILTVRLRAEGVSRPAAAVYQDGGWKQVEQCNKMIIFAAEKGTARPLETDEAVRLESIRQSMNRQYGIALIIMVLGLVLCIWRTFSAAGMNVHEDWFIANANLIYMWILEAYFWIWFIGIFTSYRMWLKASQRALLSGAAPADTAKYSWIYQALTRPRLLVILGAATLIIIRMIIKAGGI